MRDEGVDRHVVGRDLIVVLCDQVCPQSSCGPNRKRLSVCIRGNQKSNATNSSHWVEQAEVYDGKRGSELHWWHALLRPRRSRSGAFSNESLLLYMYTPWLGTWAKFGISWPSAALKLYRESRYSSLGQPARAMIPRIPNREFSYGASPMRLWLARSWVCALRARDPASWCA